MITLDAAINSKKLVSSIQKGVDIFNKSTAGRSKLNLKINEKGFRQPLGRITGDLDKFESALAASNARVIAFGASTAVIGGMTKAFKELALTTIAVQKSFADINRILNVSNREFDSFSTSLFNIGKKTATTFEDSSKAALEFARQGLGLNETLKRTADALTLVRLTGVNADKAVSALTATVNAFQQSSLTTTEALNKFVAVETQFAVSARDLMEGLGRVGSAAVDAKVNFNELNAMVAAVQQQTGRGGAVIGNALKTIFTRLQRRDTLTALESYGIAVRNVEGQTRPAMAILQDFAKTYDTLADSNKAYLREQVAGVFQANILSAIVKDLNSKTQVYNKALTVSTDATNEADMANARLNRTLSALISQTGTELVRLQENVGKVTFEPIAKGLLAPFKGLLEGMNNVLDGEGLGSEVANGMLKGIRNVLAGPGLVGALAIIGSTIIKTVGFMAKALPTLVGITTETQKRANLEATINAMLSTDAGLTKKIAKHEGDAAVQAGLLLGAAQKAETAFAAAAVTTAAIAKNLAAAGMTTNKAGQIVPRGGRGAFGRGAGGFIPGAAGEMHDIQRGVGGVSSSARPVHIPNFAFGGGQHGSMVANTGEHIVPNFKGGGSAIFNPAMVRANGGLPQGAKKITAAQGYVPNFAMNPSTALGRGASLSDLTKGIISGQYSAINVGQNYQIGKRTVSAAAINKRITDARVKRDAAKKKVGAKVDPNTFSIPASELGIGAIVGFATRTPNATANTTSAFSTLAASPNIANPNLKAYMNDPKNKAGKNAKKIQLTGIPIGAISRVGRKGSKAAKSIESKFSQRLNKFMMPALNRYTASIFKQLLKDDGRGFIKNLRRNKKRVFSTSVEGGIMEASLSLAGRNSKSFGGDDAARFDFEEGGTISAALADTFFKGKKVTRADAKRSDSAPNIKTLIAKSAGTPATSNALWAQLVKRGASKGSPKAAQGYVPNFYRGGMTVGSLRSSQLSSMLPGIGTLKASALKKLFQKKNVDKLRDVVSGRSFAQLPGSHAARDAVKSYSKGAMQGWPVGTWVAWVIMKYGKAVATNIVKMLGNVAGGKSALKNVSFGKSISAAGGARGYIPNFVGGGLGAAIGREKAAGIPSSAIRINSSPSFQSPQNPAGLAVTNKFDEPRGLADVPNFAFGGLFGGGASPFGTPLTSGGKGGRTPVTLKAEQQLERQLKKVIKTYKKGDMSREKLDAERKRLTKKMNLSGNAEERVQRSLNQRASAIDKARMQAGTHKPGGGLMVGGPGGRAATGAGGGMGGIMAMMMVPMVGGMAEQAIGGQRGAAVSGATTGGMMGGMLGYMGGGAMATAGMFGLKGAAAGPWGAAAGIAIGATMGAITAWNSAAESATEHLQNFTTELNASIGGANAYMVAQKAMAEATTMEQFEAAANGAADALLTIDDPQLRDALVENKTEFQELTKVIREYKEEEMKRILLEKGIAQLSEKELSNKPFTQAGYMKAAGMQGQFLPGILGDGSPPTGGALSMHGYTIDPTREGANREDVRKMEEAITQRALGGLLQYFSGMGFEAQDVGAIQGALGIPAGQNVGGQNPFAGRIDQEAIFGALEKLRKRDDPSQKLLDTDVSRRLADMVAALDPGGAFAGVTTSEEEFNKSKFLQIIMDNLANAFAQFNVKNRQDMAKVAEQKKAKFIFIEEFKKIVADVDQAILDSARITRDVAFQVSRRTTRQRARTELIGRRQDTLVAQGEAFGVTATNLGARRANMAQPIIGAQARALSSLIAEINQKGGQGAPNLQELTTTLMDPLRAGNIMDVVKNLRDRLAADPQQAGGLADQAIRTRAETMARNLEDAWGKAGQVLDQQEMVLLDEHKINLVRAEILKAERDIQLQKNEYLNSLKLQQVSEEIRLKKQLSALEMQGKDPRTTRGMSLMEQRDFTSSLERQKIVAQQESAKTQLGLEIKAQKAEMEATFLLNKSTLVLVESNAELLKAINSNTKAQGGTVPGGTPGAGDVGTGGAQTLGDLVKAGKLPASMLQAFPATTGISSTGAVTGEPVVVKGLTIAEHKEKIEESIVGHKKETLHLETESEKKGKALTGELQQQQGLFKQNSKLREDTLKKRGEGELGIFDREDAQERKLLGRTLGPGAFEEGLGKGMKTVRDDGEKIFHLLGERLPVQLRDGLVGAMEAGLDGATSIGDAMRTMAADVLKMIRRAFLQRIATNMVEAVPGMPKKRMGGLIRAQAGLSVPGSGTGDKIPIMAEPNEYVLNKNAVAAMGGAQALDKLNFNMAPRFGNKMSVNEDPFSSKMSGLYYATGSPELEELAAKMRAKDEKRAAKKAEKRALWTSFATMVASAAVFKGMDVAKEKGWGPENWGQKLKTGSANLGNRLRGGDKSTWVDIHGSAYSRMPQSQIDTTPTAWPKQQHGGIVGRYGLGSGYQTGGSVPALSSPSSNTNNISINISTGSGQQGQSTGGQQGGQSINADGGATAKEFSMKVAAAVREVIATEQRVGGSLSPGGRRR